jgi:hypothetical protein
MTLGGESPSWRATVSRTVQTYFLGTPKLTSLGNFLAADVSSLGDRSQFDYHARKEGDVDMLGFNRFGIDRSLVAGVSGISRQRRFNSPSARRGPDSPGSAFRGGASRRIA